MRNSSIVRLIPSPSSSSSRRSLPKPHTVQRVLQQSLDSTQRNWEGIKTVKHPKKIGQGSNDKLSVEHLSFLMEEQRAKEMRTIRKSIPLSKYYDCLNRLFMTCFQTSLLIQANIFTIEKDTFGLNSLRIVGVILEEFETVWHEQKINRLRIMAANLGRMAISMSDFQRRTEFVARKVCLHHSKRDQIQHAFLNQKLSQSWKRIEQKSLSQKQLCFMEEMFEHPAEKFCFLNFTNFVNRSLCNQHFSEKIKKLGFRKEIDEDLCMNFTIEFLLIEQLCLEGCQEIRKPKITRGECSVM